MFQKCQSIVERIKSELRLIGIDQAPTQLRQPVDIARLNEKINQLGCFLAR